MKRKKEGKTQGKRRGERTGREKGPIDKDEPRCITLEIPMVLLIAEPPPVARTLGTPAANSLSR